MTVADAAPSADVPSGPTEVAVSTVRHCFALDLADDPALIEQYRLWHRPGGPPAAVTRSIREAGILFMEIWLVGPRLFMIMETGPDYDPDRKTAVDLENPDVVAWETLMWRFQRTLPFAPAGTKWVSATRIYDLREQP